MAYIPSGVKYTQPWTDVPNEVEDHMYHPVPKPSYVIIVLVRDFKKLQFLVTVHSFY
jgi:hypothetical protein